MENEILQTEKNKKPGITQNDYIKLVAELRLARVRLAECHIETYLPRPQPKKTQIKILQDSEKIHKIQGNEPQIAFVQHSCVIFHASENHDEEYGKIEVTYEFVYSFSKEIEENSQFLTFLEAFQEYNLPLNSWPFIREFVHTTMGRMDWPIFTLPLLRPILNPE